LRYEGSRNSGEPSDEHIGAFPGLLSRDDV
jgi:hypothetical protein